MRDEEISTDVPEIFFRVSLFQHLKHKQIKQLHKHTKEIQYKPGDFLIREDDYALDLFVITSGSVEVLKDGNRVAVLSQGDYFGEIALFDQELRTASVRALENTTCSMIAIRDLRKLAKKHEAYNELLHVIADSHHQKSEDSNVERYDRILSKTAIFKNIPQEHLNSLHRISKEIQFNSNTYIIHEDDPAIDLFVILKGKVEITKRSSDGKEEHILAVLGPGDTIGEVALIDDGLRSASVRTLEHTTALAISIKDIKRLAETDSILNSVLSHIAKTLSLHLRHTNTVVVKTLEQRIEEYQARVSIGHVLIATITMLCFYVIIHSKLVYLRSILPADSFVTIGLTLVSLFFLVYIQKTTEFSLSMFGLNTNNWRKAVKEGVLFTLPLMLGVFILRVIYVYFIADHPPPLFDTYSAVVKNTTPESQYFQIWLTSLLTYSLVIAPVQELVARGCIQSSLQLFLAGPYSRIIALVCSNLMFGITHIFLSVNITIISFFVGIFWGWMYMRHNTILGCALSHTLLGVWCFWILGLHLD